MEMKQLTFFLGTYSNLTPYLSVSKTVYNISVTFKIEISQFYDQSEPKQWRGNKIRYFPRDIFKLGIIFIGCKIPNYFHDFYNCANLTAFF